MPAVNSVNFQNSVISCTVLFNVVLMYSVASKGDIWNGSWEKTNKIPDKLRGEWMAMGELYWLFEQYKNLASAFVFVKRKQPNKT